MHIQEKNSLLYPELIGIEQFFQILKISENGNISLISYIGDKISHCIVSLNAILITCLRDRSVVFLFNLAMNTVCSGMPFTLLLGL